MEKEKVVLDFGKKKIDVEVYDCRGLMQGIGLMFSRREKAKNLIFKLPREGRLAIHSFFVFYDFVAVWLNSDGKVVEMKTVRPFSPYVCPKKDFFALVEIPINKKNRSILDEIERFK